MRYILSIHQTGEYFFLSCNLNNLINQVLKMVFIAYRLIMNQIQYILMLIKLTVIQKPNFGQTRQRQPGLVPAVSNLGLDPAQPLFLQPIYNNGLSRTDPGLPTARTDPV